MIIDMHAHSSGISWCCGYTVAQVLETAKSVGIDAIVLTNHYQKLYIGDGEAMEFARKYIDEFYTAQSLSSSFGIKTFFGLEVTMEKCPNVHMLVYDVEPSFVEENMQMFDYTQEELYNAVKAKGGVLVQAHPFRNGSTVLNTEFLDGIEINCHPAYGYSYSEEIIDIAKKNNLMVTCGGDFHADTYRPVCGVRIDEKFLDGEKIMQAFLNGKTELLVHEPNTDRCEEIVYERNAL